MQNINIEANPGIIRLKPYVPGKPIESLKREFQIDNVIKLASNENPLGPSAKVVEPITETLPNLHLYPDSDSYELKHKLAKHLNVNVNQLTLGNGSDSLLHLIALTFAAAGQKIIFSEYGFAMYKITAQLVNACPFEVQAKHYEHDLDAFAAAIDNQTKLIFLANPNNPTGTWFNQEALLNFLSKVPEEILIVLDEAYYEYVTQADYPDAINLIQKFPNLVITRTFSKIYGLAGLRIGYAIAHSDITDLLNRARLPFNINSLAQVAALAALDDQLHINKSLELNISQKQYFEEQLKRLNLTYIPSLGNFITIEFGDKAQDVYTQLLRKGIIVRPLLNYNMPRHLRISFGTKPQNQFLFETLEQVLRSL